MKITGLLTENGNSYLLLLVIVMQVYAKCSMCPLCCWATPLTNGAINENQLIFDEVKAYKNDAIFLGHLDIIPAGCDIYFRQ